MNRPEYAVPPGLREQGAFRWPGRERLTARDRLIIESRTKGELVLGLAELEGDLEAQLGFFEYLLQDCLRLRDPERAGSYASFHGLESGAEAGEPLDCWRALCN